MLEKLGTRLQNLIDWTEQRAASRRPGPALLGVGLAVAALAGGIVVFLAVFVVLVGLFA